MANYWGLMDWWGLAGERWRGGLGWRYGDLPGGLDGLGSERICIKVVNLQELSKLIQYNYF